MMQSRSVKGRRNCVRALALGTFICLTSAVVIADEMDVAQVIDSRQRNLRDMGAAYKAIGDQLKRSTPNMSEMAQYARSLKEISAGQKHWFPVGSGPESGEKTA